MMIVKQFKNGNINVKMEASDCGYDGTLIHLLWALYDNGCIDFGGECCLNDWEMGCVMYSYYSDKKITVPYRLIEELEAGKTIKLYAEPLDKYDREAFGEIVEL